MISKQKIAELSDGNPGAALFLVELAKNTPSDWATDKIIELGLTGWKLYVLYSDLCEKDISAVVLLLKNCPEEILKDACSRQDYSGAEMVAPYLLIEDKYTPDAD